MSENKGVNVLKVWESNNKIHIPNKDIKLEIFDQIASLFSIAPFYYFILNFETTSVDLVSGGVAEVLGLKPAEFTVNNFFQILHPEDLALMDKKEEAVLDFLLKNINSKDLPLYKVVYLMRLKNKDGKYRTILHQARTINTSAEGKIQQVLGIHSDVTYLNIPFNNRISFIGSGKPSYYAIESTGQYKLEKNNFIKIFTNREIEIIKEISVGKTSVEIATKLNLSHHTINTHKKNILRKAKCKNTAELVGKCISEGVI